MEFLGFSERALTEKALLKILAEPETAKLPKKVGDLYALITYISSRGKEDEIVQPAAKLLNRLSPELAVLLSRDLLRVNPKFARQKGYIDFVREHSDLLA
jgi:hypothetical protein